ncbi:uncharacterized protein DNG_02291 [Cephalotrichum gorgonifer]|uniref:Prion-inhibition and propagation HeLo domain-containing protein n=1 Tax=Cephalotrichum gorgonifer TaxID=2041049 RepID=A0AAE8SSJ0_9PEZI|nr:uncharacterized protein DNG_02291 [Cephalotrichum gorgonifer]
MSEAFGIVAGAAGLVQFLEVIRKSYDAISRARTFDSDYLSYLLRLSICHLRFNRWHTTSNPETGSLGVENILEHLNKLFARALKIASSSVPVSPNIASPPASGLSSLTHEIRELVIALQQRSEASRRKKARKVISWVFHRYNSLKEVIIDIEKFLDSLEKLSPPEEDQYRRRMADEVEKIAKGQRELAFLMMAARLTDRSLSNAAAERMDPTPFNSSAASQQGNRASQQGHGGVALVLDLNAALGTLHSVSEVTGGRPIDALRNKWQTLNNFS